MISAMNRGTSRKERAVRSLDPSYFKLDGRSLSDLFKETLDFSKKVVYEEKEISGSWESFFEEGQSYLQKVENDEFSRNYEKNCPPHLSLFLSFLKLFQSVQKQFNSLTKEHLLFFYRKILDQEKFGLIGDKVYIFPEMARNSEKFHLKKGSKLLAGKDLYKNNIIYRTEKDLFLNKAFISKIHAIYRDENTENPSIYVFRNLPSLNEEKTQSSEEIKGWPPFGDPKLLKDSAELGFGLSSSILFLPEGKRTIEISIKIGEQDEAFLKNKNRLFSSLEAHLSSQEEWLIKPLKNLRIEDTVMVFSVELSHTDPPVQISEEISESVFFKSTVKPVIKIVFKQDYSSELYSLIRKINFKKIEVAVKVEGLEALKVKNDYGILDASQAFQAFGYVPVVGSNLFLHADELVHKNITAASVTLNWKDVPENFKAYYEGYLGQTNSLVEGKEDFRIKLAIRRNKEWLHLKNREESTFGLFQDRIDFEVTPQADDSLSIQADKEQGMIRLTLTAPAKAFGHNLYPVVYTRAIMAQGQQREAPIPNPPYTPTLESVSLDYEAIETFSPETNENTIQRFFHIEPFGIHNINFGKPPFQLLSPHFNTGGQLFLGIQRFTPPAQLSLFFDIKEENTGKLPEIEWSYLNNKGWKRFSETQLLSDSTFGLRKTGIITINIPKDAIEKGELMPEGLYWLKIETRKFPEKFDRILSVRTNAVLCSLEVSGIDPAYKVNELMPGTISSLEKKINQVQKIEQPYSSFGGRPAEDDQSFFTRISEKLSHKNRAVTAWDFEHLVLQEFPEIYQVICNSCRNAKGEILAGQIHVLVIPRVRASSQNLIQKPIVSGTLLQKIKIYLESIISPHVQLSLDNPYYEELQVHADISFRDNVDAGFYLKKLEADLKRFLSPWAFDHQEKIELGNRIYRSSIIKFIEVQAYVNFIARIKIYRNKKLITSGEIYTGEHSILISSNTHQLQAVEPDALLCQTNQGIGQMIMDINFQVD